MRGEITRVCEQEYINTNDTITEHKELIGGNCVSKVGFQAMDVSRASFKLGPHESETYIQLPREIEKGNVARKSLEPVSVLDGTCSERGQRVRNFLTEECGGNPHLLANRCSSGRKKICI